MGMKVGFDIGGVIAAHASRVHGKPVQRLADAIADAPPIAGAVDGLKLAVELFGAENVFLVSKCYPNVQRATVSWLDKHWVLATAGIPFGNVRFCLHRREKRVICESLGIKLFVDDRRDIIDSLEGFVATRVLFRDGISPGTRVPAARVASDVPGSQPFYEIVGWEHLAGVLRDIGARPAIQETVCGGPCRGEGSPTREHDWSGPVVDVGLEGGATGQSVTCRWCGMTALDHALLTGP